MSGLSRDTEHANDGSISPIFDKEKEQRRLQQAQLVNDVATHALDVYNTHEAARATRAATASLADTDTRTALEAQAKAVLDKAHEKDPNVDNSRQAVVSKAWQLAYDQAIVRQGADMGGSVRTGVNAVVNALQALAGGDIRAALAQGAAPYLAAKVKELTTDNAPYGELTDTQKLNNLMAHALLGGVVAELSGGSAAAGATGAVTGELATPAIALALYGTADSDKLSPDQKANLSALATLASGIAAGVSSGSTAGAATGALAGKNAVENNFLSSTSSEKRDALAEKVLKGDKSLQTAKDFLQLENADKRSDALVAKFNKEPAELSTAERTELVSYLKIYASDMQAKYGEAVTKELIAGMLTGQDYMKSAPQTEAQQKAQTIMNTWGYHKSNASIGDPVLLFGSSVLGTTIKEGMALNAAIGVGVNTGVKLSGNDPFSYVDAILAGVTAAATTGKSWQASAAINMGGAAIGSAIKGEDPTNSVISTGFGSAAGSLGGKVVDSLSPVTDQVTKDVIGAVTGSTASELTGKAVKDELDKREKKQ
ncbi:MULTISPECIES: VENN motif pre-toxin domain-containing protein [Pantoea]|nr:MULTISPECIES: VENN motif pre-toxin domain-containing protein [Pantoea]MCH9269295.1 VENN motif pre-toxin domain-containing protein [Pantoea ananatis]MDI3367398.1 VENN motif pre-toxin domain-containing protein [Pantoea sp. V108_6]